MYSMRLMLHDKTTAAGLTDNTIKKRVVPYIYCIM